MHVEQINWERKRKKKQWGNIIFKEAKLFTETFYKVQYITAIAIVIFEPDSCFVTYNLITSVVCW